jgi:hypothetical protein
VQTFIATFVLFGVMVGAMAMGVMLTGNRLRGSCGGTGEDCACTEAEQQKCPRRPSAQAS